MNIHNTRTAAAHRVRAAMHRGRRAWLTYLGVTNALRPIHVAINLNTEYIIQRGRTDGCNALVSLPEGL